MGILDILLSEIKIPGADLTQQVREICDKIMKQEKPNMKHPDIAPKGSTVFLSVEAPGRYKWEIGFLTLEREDIERYIVVYHTIEKHRIEEDNKLTPRRRKIWVVDENKAKKILTRFAEILQMKRGE